LRAMFGTLRAGRRGRSRAAQQIAFRDRSRPPYRSIETPH
jgi:hypothetical protein